MRATPEAPESIREHNVLRLGPSSAARFVGWLSPEAVLRGQNGSQQTDGVTEQHRLGYRITPNDKEGLYENIHENPDHVSQAAQHDEASAALET